MLSDRLVYVLFWSTLIDPPFSMMTAPVTTRLTVEIIVFPAGCVTEAPFATMKFPFTEVAKIIRKN